MSLDLYPIIQPLGNGGFGKTYLATNTLMPSKPYCVVKQLIPTCTEPSFQGLIQERFQQEARVLESLGEQSNGSIPKLYAYFVQEGEFYLVQEYIKGQTLRERVMSQGLLTEIQLRQLLTDVLPTLTYVHSRGMVHRDIKPENIMLREENGRPVLIDFGAVKEIMSTVVPGQSGHIGSSIVIGTPAFMPAEQLSGRPMFTSDIYALGLTAIYALTGRLPNEIEVDPASGNVKWREHTAGVSPQLFTVLDTAINPIPNARYSSAQNMLSALTTSISYVPANPSQPVGGGQSAPTMVAAIPPDNTVQTQVSYQQPQAPYPLPISFPSPSQQYIVPSGTTEIKTQGNPLLPAVIGVAIGGGLIAAGLILGKNFTETTSNTKVSVSPRASVSPSSSVSPVEQESRASSVSRRENPSSASSSSSSNISNNNIPPQSTAIASSPPVGINSDVSRPSSSSPITREAATALINQWLNYKRVLFAPPYNKSKGGDILFGKAYADNIDKSLQPCNSRDADDCISSVDWLRKYGAQYSFGVQRIDSINRFEANGDHGTIFATVTEFRTLHKSGDRSTSSGGTKQARYDLKFDNGRVKISDYKVLN
jgi:serine/threonine protein kinase